MTLRYSHLAPGHKRKAVNLLDKNMRHAKNVEFTFTSRFDESLAATESHNSTHNNGRGDWI